MTFPSPIEIAWMAALFEGEGCVDMPRSRTDRGGRHSSPFRIKFKMCDRDVLERFHRYAGGGILIGPHKPSGLGKKMTYSFSVQGPRAYALLVAFWPWLGERRREQVSKAMIKWGTMKPKLAGVVLSRDDATAIRAALASGKHGIGKQLASQYGVSNGMISAIKYGRVWL